jgi:hypothetical protein
MAGLVSIRLGIDTGCTAATSGQGVLGLGKSSSGDTHRRVLTRKLWYWLHLGCNTN